MTGTNPDAIEAWAFDAVTFEHLLERLEPYGRVVLLSGDVHYSSGTVMSYWRGNATQPGTLRAVHLERLQERDAVDDHLRRPGHRPRPAAGPAEPRHRADRLGPAGRRPGAAAGGREVRGPRAGDAVAAAERAGDGADLGLARPQRPRPSTRRPAGSTRRPPDWRWRVKPAARHTATSPNDRRASGSSSSMRTPRTCSRPGHRARGLPAVAARHQHALNRLRNARQILFRANVGRVRFESRPTARLNAVHEVFTTFSDPDQPADARRRAGALPGAGRHPRTRGTRSRPGGLREKAIEPGHPTRRGVRDGRDDKDFLQHLAGRVHRPPRPGWRDDFGDPAGSARRSSRTSAGAPLATDPPSICRRTSSTRSRPTRRPRTPRREAAVEAIADIATLLDELASVAEAWVGGGTSDAGRRRLAHALARAGRQQLRSGSGVRGCSCSCRPCRRSRT